MPIIWSHMNPYVLTYFVVSLLFCPCWFNGSLHQPPVDVSPRVGTTCGGDSQELPGASAMAIVWVWTAGSTLAVLWCFRMWNHVKKLSWTLVTDGKALQKKDAKQKLDAHVSVTNVTTFSRKNSGSLTWVGMSANRYKTVEAVVVDRPIYA